MTFQAHALDVLEFARLLDHVAGHASSTPGAERIRALRPLRVGGTHLERAAALDALRAEQVRVIAMRALVTAEGGWRPEAVPELTEPLARLRVVGTLWTGRELRAAITLLVSSRRTQAALRDEGRHPAARAPLARYADALVTLPAIERRLEAVLNDEGELKDDASPSLRRIRREMRGAEGELVRLLERLMSKLESHHRVDDGSVTLRNGRYVIPVRREGRGSFSSANQNSKPIAVQMAGLQLIHVTAHIQNPDALAVNLFHALRDRCRHGDPLPGDGMAVLQPRHADFRATQAEPLR